MVPPLNAQWQIAGDPENRGREQKWFERTPAEAQPAPVPGIIQQVLPDYHGVVGSAHSPFGAIRRLQ